MMYATKVSGLEIATDTVANATNIFSLATKNSGISIKYYYYYYNFPVGRQKAT